MSPTEADEVFAGDVLSSAEESLVLQLGSEPLEAIWRLWLEARGCVLET